MVKTMVILISFILLHATSNLSTYPVVFSFKICLEFAYLPPPVLPYLQAHSNSLITHLFFSNWALCNLFPNPIARIISLNHKSDGVTISLKTNGFSYPTHNTSLYEVLNGLPWTPLSLNHDSIALTGCLSWIILHIPRLSKGLRTCFFLYGKLSF